MVVKTFISLVSHNMLIDQYKQIQQKIADKKASGQNLVTNQENINQAIAQYWKENVNQALAQVQQGGVGINYQQTQQPQQPTSMPAGGTAPVQAPMSQMNTTQPITQAPTPPTPWVTMDSNTWKPYEAPKIEQPKLTPEQEKIQTDKINKLNSNLSLYSTGKSLYDAVQGGSILPWTQEFTDLTARNPKVLEEYNALKTQKDKENAVKTLGQAVVSEPIQNPSTNILEQIASYFTKGMNTDIAQEYQNTVTNNPAYQSAVQNYNGINQQIADNNNNINKLREDVRKKYSAWTPESLIASAIAREARPLIEQGQYLSQLQANAQAEMTRIFDENKTGFEIKQQQEQQNMERAYQLYGTVRGEEIRQEDFARADKKLADEIARTDKKDTEKLAQLEKDYIRNIKEAVAALGVTPVGETYDELLGEYATAVKNQPQKNEYIQTDKPIYDTASGKWILPPWAEPTRQAPAPTREPTVKSSFTPEWTFKVDIANGATPRKSSRGYYECAMLVNDTLGTAMPDLHVDKLKYNNSDVPVVGGAFIEKTNDKYGHTGIIESINSDGTLNIVETNYPVGSGVTRKTIDPSKRNIVGYYNPQTAWQSWYMDITDITLPEKTTEFKAKSFGFGTRMDNSDKTLQNIDKKFMESGTTWEYLTPRGDYVPNWLKWTEQQQYEQAQRDFINAKLRQESGAVISPSEFDNARKQYFPQPWDTNETILQKQKNRELVILEMFRNAGKTEKWEEIQGVYKNIRSNRTQWTTQEEYSPQEQQLIKDLVAKWATDDEIDQAIILFRK